MNSKTCNYKCVLVYITFSNDNEALKFADNNEEFSCPGGNFCVCIPKDTFDYDINLITKFYKDKYNINDDNNITVRIIASS